MAGKAWEEFLSEVESAKKELGGIVWFRGQANADWKLIPSLFRCDAARASEKKAYDQFVRLGPTILKNGFSDATSDWSNLFDMQHYGVPTRLLDWTTTFGMAVFFAQPREGADSAVFLINPYKLNQATMRKRTVNLKFIDYTKKYLSTRITSKIYPFAIEPKCVNERLLAQDGVFTVHGSLRDCLAEQFPKCIKQIILSRSAAADANKVLDQFGMHSLRVFPDTVGLGRFVTVAAGLRPKITRNIEATEILNFNESDRISIADLRGRRLRVTVFRTFTTKFTAAGVWKFERYLPKGAHWGRCSAAYRGTIKELNGSDARKLSQEFSVLEGEKIVFKLRSSEVFGLDRGFYLLSIQGARESSEFRVNVKNVARFSIFTLSDENGREELLPNQKHIISASKSGNSFLITWEP